MIDCLLGTQVTGVLCEHALPQGTLLHDAAAAASYQDDAVQ